MPRQDLTPDREPPRRPLPSPALPASAWVGLPFAALLAFVCAVGVLAAPTAPEDRDVAAKDRAAPPPEPPPATETLERDTLRPGETLETFLADHGLTRAEVANLAELMRPTMSPRSLRPGAELVVHRTADGALPARLRLKTDADRILDFTVAGARWRLRIDSVPVTVDTVVVAGDVTTSLYTADLYGDADHLTARERALLANRLSDVFAWQVDFYRDIRRGDAFRVLLQRHVRPDGTARRSRVLAAELWNRGRRLGAIRYAPPGEPAGYYDEEGRALEGAFLRAPLDYVRVTSRFRRRRYHPVLRRWRAHLGTDYGAAPGTPVRATGSAVVSRAGWWGGYGLMVELRHEREVRTRYGHLSALAPGLAVGDRVAQGEVIGRVGATGLATGPHLHYEFRQHGRATDPARADVPRAAPLEEAERPAFERVRRRALARLRSVPLGGAPSLASGSAGGRTVTDD